MSVAPTSSARDSRCCPERCTNTIHCSVDGARILCPTEQGNRRHRALGQSLLISRKSALCSSPPNPTPRSGTPSRPGTRLPTHAGALGLAILSRRGTQGLPEHLKKFTDNSMDTTAKVEEALREYSLHRCCGQHWTAHPGRCRRRRAHQPERTPDRVNLAVQAQK